MNHLPEDRNFHIYQRDNIKSHINGIYLTCEPALL
jgi:hypothetical protein